MKKQDTVTIIIIRSRLVAGKNGMKAQTTTGQTTKSTKKEKKYLFFLLLMRTPIFMSIIMKSHKVLAKRS